MKFAQINAICDKFDLPNTAETHRMIKIFRGIIIKECCTALGALEDDLEKEGEKEQADGVWAAHCKLMDLK